MSPLNQGLIMALLLTLALFLALVLIQRRRRKARVEAEPPVTRGGRLRRAAVYAARLGGFTLLAILVIYGGAAVYISFLSIDGDTAPAPSRVELPEGLPFTVEEMTFTGGEGLKLAGWFIPGEKAATIILLHGYNNNRTMMLWHAGVLAKAGYSILMYDERASGESEGDHRSYGWEDPEDVRAALEYLAARPETKADRVGIAGCSIGAQIALQAAAGNPGLAAVWADGPSLVTTRDTPTPFNWFTLVTYPPNLLMDRMLADRLGRRIPRAMIDLIGTIEPRPVMLVAGGNPKPLVGPESILTSYFFAHAGAHASLWVVPEATHCDGPVQRPGEYAARLVEFFDSAFGLNH